MSYLDFQELWKNRLSKCFVPNGEDPLAYLKKQSVAGLSRKYGERWNENKDIKARLEYELNKIIDLEMDGFYLALGDIVSYAKSNDILISPGCGAIPGSLVAYCLGITDVDPMKYNLLMDRLLSQKQESQTGCRIEPEIGGSQRLTDYVIEKYGKGILKLLEGLDITYRDIDEV